jgi:hypothetical protein
MWFIIIKMYIKYVISAALFLYIAGLGLMRTKQKVHPNFSIVIMEVNKLSTHLGAHPTVHVNEVRV